MTKITVISGFGQEPETFKNVFSNKDVIALNYLESKNFEDLLTRDLKAYDNEVVVWLLLKADRFLIFSKKLTVI